MSGNKNEKDSYAQDTLAFSVPNETVRKKNVYPNDSRPPRQRRPEQYSQEQYGYDQYPQEAHEQGQPIYDQYQGQYIGEQYFQGQPPQEPRQQGRRPQGQPPQGSRQQGRRPQGQPSQGSRQQGRRPQGQPPQGPRQQGRRPQGQPPQEPRQQGRRPQKQRVQGQKRNNPQRLKENPNGNLNRQRRKHVKKKGGCLKKVILSFLGLLLFVFIVYSVIVMIVISKVEVNEDGERISPTHSLYDDSDVKNILLIGNDSRGKDRGRSDSMILLSINSSTNKINLVSLMRDTYVQVPGYGGCKLNAAYSYGGPELLMDTIEENFYIKIDDYISVNFTSFAGIVDSIGGVEIDINEDEALAINALLDSKEGVSLFGTPDASDYLDGAGRYKLNGKQALCYARLRKVGNADFERTERQRKVLSELFGNMGFSSIFSIIGNAFPDVSTNMSKLQMYGLSLRLPFILGFYDIEQLRIPAEDTFWSSDVDGQDVLEIDIDANLEIIERDIYGK